MKEEALARPDEQPYLPRLSGAGSLRRELEAVLGQAPPETTLEGYRELILERNAAGKRSASMRSWTWKRLKVRYLLNPRVPEFRAFRAAMDGATDPADRGIVALLMMARTDRLFREITAEHVSPHLLTPGTEIDPSSIRTAVEQLAVHAPRPWSPSVIEGTAVHVLSACKDYGLLEGTATKRTVRVRPGPSALGFGVRLARQDGLSDRYALESRWFTLLGLRMPDVLDLMHRAARSGALGFRFQADVAEIVLPELAEAGS